MPASASALTASGWRAQPGHFANSAVVAHPKLAVLGDIFATPRWFPLTTSSVSATFSSSSAVGVLVYKTCAAKTGVVENGIVQSELVQSEIESTDSHLKSQSTASSTERKLLTLLRERPARPL